MAVWDLTRQVGTYQAKALILRARGVLVIHARGTRGSANARPRIRPALRRRQVPRSATVPCEGLRRTGQFKSSREGSSSAGALNRRPHSTGAAPPAFHIYAYLRRAQPPRMRGREAEGSSAMTTYT